jgi:threonine dehydrogenase-like Zn-dependent dehydrogenase
MRFPVAIGHEFAGEVVEVGPAVTRGRPGDPVAVEAMHWCGSCRACLQGLFNACLNGEDHGFTYDGGSSEYVVARERHCWSLNEIRDRRGEAAAYDVGAVIEPTSISYNGMFTRAGGFPPGQHVAVFGCGPVGLAAVGLARAAGAGKVVAVDTQPERRALAGELGADVSLDPVALADADTSAGAEILALTGGAGVAMAVEASGAGRAVMPEIERSLALGGKVVLVGMEHGAAPVETLPYQLKAGSIYGTLGHLGGFESSINLHAAGRIDMSAMVTARFALDAGVAAIERAAERRDAKILIYPHGEARA